jgi:two-component system LytT family response regulator
LENLAGQLDSNKFVRIHRRMIVAVHRIVEMRPLANGDAVLTLLDGRELRVSRRYRAAVRNSWTAPGSQSTFVIDRQR